jgi:hypothetical protein
MQTNKKKTLSVVSNYFFDEGPLTPITPKSSRRIAPTRINNTTNPLMRIEDADGFVLKEFT